MSRYAGKEAHIGHAGLSPGMPPPDSSLDDVVGLKQGTGRDVQDMRRLGKQQVFKRNFNLASILGFSLIVMATWQAILGAVAFGLGNGGPSGLLYTYLAVWFMYILVMLSMAELASMAPTSGGQYHWISEFAPRKYERHLSYFIGWLSALGWQVGNSIAVFGAGTMLQGLIVVNYPDSYVKQRWHGTLMATCISTLAALFNIFLPRHLPVVEIFILVLHFAGFFVLVIALWAMAPSKTPHELVWNSFMNAGEWSSVGVACLVGSITNVVSFAGGDAAAHMSEELRNASKTLPRAMIGAVLLNGGMGLVALITFCYTMGDIEASLATETGYPIIEVIHSATGSTAGVNGLIAILILLGMANGLTTTAGASRQLFAFARDGAVPLRGWIHYIHPGRDVPINAVIITGLTACVFHCINIGSEIAWNVINSLGSTSLLTSYMVCIGCLLYRRLTGPLLPAPFKMSKPVGIVVNSTALAMLVVAWVMAFFPAASHPEAATMNWASVIYAGVLLLALVYYLTFARRFYVSPIEQVKQRAGELLGS